MNDKYFNEMIEALTTPEMIQKKIGSTIIEMPYRTKNEERALKARQRAGEKLPGRRPWKNGRRVRKIENLTNRDYIILILLSKTRYASTTQLAMLQQVKPNTISKRMQLLENIKLVKGFVMVEGGKKIWGLTGKGLNLLHNNNLIPKTEGQKGYKATEKMGHYLAITQTYIMFLYGKVLNDMDPVSINDILSERYVERAFREFKTQKELIYFNVRTKARDSYRNAERTNDYKNISSVPQVWVPLNERTNSWHLPDAVVSFENERTSEAPVSYAVEVELSMKPVKDLVHILETYKNSKQYKAVIYVVHDEKVYNQIVKAAKKINFRDIKFVKLLDKNWKPYAGMKCWDL